MFARGLTEDDIRHIVSTGEVIEDYPDDEPFRSRVILGYCGNRPVHVVVAENIEKDQRIIVTAYEPCRTKWDETFKRRIKK